MPDHKIILKGEVHSSRGDLAHERELLVESVDSLILEGPEQEAEYRLLQTWYAMAMLFTEYLFFRTLYTDTSVLEDIAKAQEADVIKTRESDASISKTRSYSLVLVLLSSFSYCSLPPHIPALPVNI